VELYHIFKNEFSNQNYMHGLPTGAKFAMLEKVHSVSKRHTHFYIVT